MWSAQAEAEGLRLRVADNNTGYFGVAHRPGKPKSYQARVTHGGKMVHLGTFATAEEAALCVVRSPESRLKLYAMVWSLALCSGGGVPF